jgi:hypothetical protein
MTEVGFKEQEKFLTMNLQTDSEHSLAPFSRHEKLI